MSEEVLANRVDELEDTLEEVMGIWEKSLDVGDSKAAGAEMIRLIRLATLGRLDDGTTLEGVRSNSIRELRHRLMSSEAQLGTAREMLRDWNPTPMADSLRVLLDGQIEEQLSEEERAELEAAKARTAATPTLTLPDEADELTVLRHLVGLQGLLLAEKGHEAVAEFMVSQRRRLGDEGGSCPKCGHNLLK